ncbi:MAG: hypothetical protein ACYTEL_08580 [Planctomycetota bacterium]|jgi:hypothetical protein
MADEMEQAVAQGSGVELCEVKFGPACFGQAVTETVETPQPDFEEVKHLCSDKPLRFGCRRKHTVRVIVGRLGSMVRMSAPQLDIVVDGATEQEARKAFLQEASKRQDSAWLRFDVGPTKAEEVSEGLNAPEDEDWPEPDDSEG